MFPECIRGKCKKHIGQDSECSVIYYKNIGKGQRQKKNRAHVI